jgi:hypothetical protein
MIAADLKDAEKEGTERVLKRPLYTTMMQEE